jgi:acetyltransferase-like isoleucine patch superfamily enzyme
LKKCTIYKNVSIGKNVVIEEYSVIGKPPGNAGDGELPTIIGDNSVIRSHAVIYAGNVIGNNFQCGHHVVMREENRIGDNVSIGSCADIEHHVTIENDVRLHSNVFVPEYTILKRGSWIGPNVVFTNARYPNSKNAKENLKGVLVKERAKIGANSTILPGVTVGENSLVGAGSVVAGDVADGTVVAGNPAKPIGNISDIKDY